MGVFYTKLALLTDAAELVILHLSEKNTTRETWEVLTKLFHSNNINMKMVLREKLRSTKMTILDTMINYLTKMT